MCVACCRFSLSLVIVVVGVAVVVVHVAVWDEATGSSLSRITGGRSSTYYILLILP